MQEPELARDGKEICRTAEPLDLKIAALCFSVNYNTSHFKQRELEVIRQDRRKIKRAYRQSPLCPGKQLPAFKLCFRLLSAL